MTTGLHQKIKQLELEVELQANEISQLAHHREETQELRLRTECAEQILSARFGERASDTVERVRFVQDVIRASLSKPRPTDSSGMSCRTALLLCEILLQHIYGETHA